MEPPNYTASHRTEGPAPTIVRHTSDVEPGEWNVWKIWPIYDSGRVAFRRATIVASYDNQAEAVLHSLRLRPVPNHHWVAAYLTDLPVTRIRQWLRSTGYHIPHLRRLSKEEILNAVRDYRPPLAAR